VEANIIGVFTWRAEGGILEANDAFLGIVGYDREDLVSGQLRWTDLTPAEWRERDERAVPEWRSTGTVQPYEKEYFRKDGGRVPVLVGAATFEEGANQGVAFLLDLTERKRAERAATLSAEALRRSEAYLAEAQWLSHSGSAAFDKTTLLYWSDETYRILGFDPRDGLPTYEAAAHRTHADDQERVREEVRRAIQQKRDFKLEYRVSLPTGAIKHIEMNAHPKFSASGELVEVVSTIIDVTERKRAQEEHERLRQLESDLAHMNRLSMMGELAASLAHEITQPIAAARNNARAALNFLGKQSPDLDEVREALGCAVGDADRAGIIIDRMRDHIKKAPPRKHRFDLNEASAGAKRHRGERSFRANPPVGGVGSCGRRSRSIATGHSELGPQRGRSTERGRRGRA
jgi:PAS domain S-box-containing protein